MTRASGRVKATHGGGMTSDLGGSKPLRGISTRSIANDEGLHIIGRKSTKHVRMLRSGQGGRLLLKEPLDIESMQ